MARKDGTRLPGQDALLRMNFLLQASVVAASSARQPIAPHGASTTGTAADTRQAALLGLAAFYARTMAEVGRKIVARHGRGSRALVCPRRNCGGVMLPLSGDARGAPPGLPKVRQLRSGRALVFGVCGRCGEKRTKHLFAGEKDFASAAKRSA